MRVLWLPVILAVGCLGGEPTPPEPVEPVAPPPPAHVDAGPGPLSADVVEAYTALAAAGRRIRCEIPAELAGGFSATGPLSAQTTQVPHDPLELPLVSGGWVSAVAPGDSHTATVVRGDKAVGMVSWRKSIAGEWNDCTIRESYPYEVVGRVTDANDEPIAGASVVGCSATKPVRSDKDGRFDLPGVFGKPCVVIAFVRDAAGLGYSPPSIVDSGGVDALLEVVVPETRVDAAAEATKLAGSLAVAEERVKSGIGQDVTRLAARIAASTLSDGAKSIADGWLADVTAREADARKRLEAARAGGKDALFAVPTEAF